MLKLSLSGIKAPDAKRLNALKAHHGGVAFTSFRSKQRIGTRRRLPSTLLFFTPKDPAEFPPCVRTFEAVLAAL